MNALGAEELIELMKTDPKGFDESGKAANDLLQFYFRGYPIETLRPLLRSDNRYILRSASFIASELGGRASPLAEEMIPLLRSEDPYIAWDAAEVLAVCSIGEKVGLYVHVLRMLENGSRPLRELTAGLIGRAGVPQLLAA
jgi:hypothetical protein